MQRMGMHSGRVVGGVVGSKIPHYSVFGDTVEIAGKMSSIMKMMMIMVSLMMAMMSSIMMMTMSTMMLFSGMMESSGVAMKIQISQATADILEVVNT